MAGGTRARRAHALGLWLLALAVTALALPGTTEADGLVRVGLLAAALVVAFGAGSDADRAALPLALTHPTTPAAVAPAARSRAPRWRTRSC